MTDCIIREEALDFLIPTFDLNISAQDQKVIGERFVEFLESIPAADVRPVVRGKWKHINNRCDGYAWQICSECGEKGKSTWNFCRNCGADMREKAE